MINHLGARGVEKKIASNAATYPGHKTSELLKSPQQSFFLLLVVTSCLAWHAQHSPSPTSALIRGARKIPTNTLSFRIFQDI